MLLCCRIVSCVARDQFVLRRALLVLVCVGGYNATLLLNYFLGSLPHRLLTAPRCRRPPCHQGVLLG